MSPETQSDPPPPIQLRPYQTDAIARLERRIEAGVRRVLLVAPTGSGKCVTRETLVWHRGLRRFGDLWGSDGVLGPCGPAVVEGWYDDGSRDGLEVTLECGLKIDGTRAHRVWARDDAGTEGWKALEDLATTDWVAVARGRADFGDTSIPSDEAYALGLLIADGCCIDGRLTIDKQTPVLERVKPVVRRWLGWAARPQASISIKSVSPRHAVLIADGEFRPLFRAHYGIDWQYSENRSIPTAVATGTHEVVAGFLRGYFDGDGYCDRTPHVSTSSPRLAEEVHQLLLGLGVYAAVSTKPTAGLPSHIVSVRDSEAFAREVGFTDFGLTKDRRFRELMARPRNTNVDVVPGIGSLLQRAAKLVPQRTLRSDSWRHIDAYYRDRRPSYSLLRRLLDTPNALPQSPERDELERIVEEHYAWSRVEAVCSSHRRRIDCQVRKQAAFIGNGLVNHNTVIAGSIISSAAARGERVVFLAHRRELINQAYRKLLEFGLPASSVGVVMATDARRRPGAPIQVASVDTLRQRPRPLGDLVFVDECHRALATSYRTIAADYPNAVHIGLTATPLRADGKGLGDAYDELIVVTSPRQLITVGFLVEPRVFTVPARERPDLSKVHVARGDYTVGELEHAVDRQGLVGNIVEHWLTHAQGLRTVAFAVSVAHSMHIAERFRQAGVPAEHLDGTTPTAERDAILTRLESGQTLVLSNVGVCTEGWDCPPVKCAILARPTKSTGLYLQQAGRILRPWQGHRAIILDHGGCALEHGLPQDDREFSLEGRKQKLSTTAAAPVRECPSCFAVVGIGTRICPECGYELIAERGLPEEKQGALVEVTSRASSTRGPPRTQQADRAMFDTLRRAARGGGRFSWATLDANRSFGS